MRSEKKERNERGMKKALWPARKWVLETSRVTIIARRPKKGFVCG